MPAAPSRPRWQGHRRPRRKHAQAARQQRHGRRGAQGDQDRRDRAVDGARGQVPRRMQHRAAQAEQGIGVEGGAAGLHHQQHAGEAGRDRHPARAAHVLVERDDGEQRDEQGRRHVDRGRVGNRQVEQRGEIGHRRAGIEHRTEQHRRSTSASWRSAPMACATASSSRVAKAPRMKMSSRWAAIR